MKFWFIDPDAKGANDGTSWADAFVSDEAAIAADVDPKDCNKRNMKGKKA